MSTTNMLQNKAAILADIGEVDRVLREIAFSGTASATLSSGGGAKSYTRQDTDKLRAFRRDLVSRLHAINLGLAGAARTGIGYRVTVRAF